MAAGIEQGRLFGRARPAARGARAPFDPLWTACALLAAVLIAAASFLPLWRMKLEAPQYPEGLRLDAYGTRMAGDLREINALNHYIGVRAIVPGDVTELQLFPYAMALVVLLTLAGAALAHGRFARAGVALAIWAVPLGMLVDLQWWLFRYGHDLNPEAAFRVDEFTPKVIGDTRVVNFHSNTMVAEGFWLLVAAALLVSVFPGLARFIWRSWNNTGQARPVAAIVAAILLTAAATLGGGAPAAAQGAFSVSAAIAAAAPGSTITVPAGVYPEQLVVDRPLTLVGEGWPVIDAGGRGTVVVISAEGVTLRGFEIRNSARSVTDEPAGIRLRGHRATIEGNRLRDVLYGIVLDESDGHTIRGNDIQSFTGFSAERRGHALYAWYSHGNTIENNRVEFAKDGIFLGFSSGNTVTGNTVTHVRYGIHFMYADDNVFTRNVFRDNTAGASLMYSRRIRLVENEFSGHRSAASGYGLLFKDMDDVEMVGNLVHHNRIGLTMDGAPHTPGAYVTLRRNLIGFNRVALEMFTTTGATFTENTFIGNLEQVESLGGSLEDRNTWAFEGRGNYWDDYRGYDAGGDGVGDLPYRYEGAYNDLVGKNEALRAYTFTPAHAALDLAARWFPVFRPVPRVVDPSPLLAPTIALPRRDPAGGAPLALGVTGLLAILPLAIFARSRRTFARGWAAC